MNVTIRRATRLILNAYSVVHRLCAADNREVNEPLIRSGLPGFSTATPTASFSLHVMNMAYLLDAAVSTGWSLEVGGADYILDEIFVQLRGEGIGRQLIAAAEDRCAELGVRRIFLETERPNDRARSLYARRGFVEDDSVWMSKDL